jgi:hypothetical protein
MDYSNSISEVTRRDILDFLVAETIGWTGRLDEVGFLKRVWDLSELPSTDGRYKDAEGDIWQHRVNNPYDWPDDWLFSDSRFELLRGPDELFCRFLAEILHPVVRPEVEEARRLATIFNEHLGGDDWELIEVRQLSGRPVFKGRKREAYRSRGDVLDVDTYQRLTDPQALREHLRRIDRDLKSDPPGAIGSSKELVETVCKNILDDYDIDYRGGADVMDLYKGVQKALGLNVDAVKDSKKGSEASVKAVRALITTIQSLTELRNELGVGHGRVRPSPALTRHARLSFNASVAVCEFLLDTWHERRAESPPDVAEDAGQSPSPAASQ